MEQSVERFIRKNGLIAGACNLVVNPLLAWLGNRNMADVPLFPAVVLDTGLTCVVMALLISLFVAADTRRAARAGSIEPASGPPCPKWLSRLPARPRLFGLALGGIVAVAAMPCLMIAHALLDVSSMSFVSFALLKAVYTPLLAYVIVRWVIVRQLSNTPV